MGGPTFLSRNRMPRPPSQAQLDFARDIARKCCQELPAEVESDARACSAYISANKDRASATPQRQPASAKQVKYAGQIRESLAGSVSEQEFQLALADSGRCSGFIRKYEQQHKAMQEEKKCRDLLNRLDVVPAALRAALSSASTLKERYGLLRDFKQNGGGYTGLDPATLHTIQEKLTAYWLEGLQSTAFEGLGKLDNLLGDDVHACFNLDSLHKALAQAPCQDLQPEDTPAPVRHIVFKLVKEGSDPDPMVLSVLAISPVPNLDAARGYDWGLAAERVPKFNRNQVGESARWPGLMLDNVEAFDAWALEQSAIAPDGGNNGATDINAAFALWDAAFDLLAMPDDGSAAAQGGIRGWIERFMAHRHEHGVLKRRRPVFAVVDGSRAGGATRNVCAAYRQVLGDPELLAQPELALYRQIASVCAGPRNDYIPSAEAEDASHVLRYAGHMDAAKQGRREAFPLDPAQRDALIALATTGPGQLLAVNGPPGTGKTSLLRGVIASLWIEPLLDDSSQPECPLLLACAATNQAVTNIISSFDETPGPMLFDESATLPGGGEVGADSRWLPHLLSYGWYVPADASKDTAYGKYQLIGRRRAQQAWQFYGAAAGLNELSPAQAEEAYRACASRYFGVQLTLREILALLRDAVRKGAAQLTAVHGAAGEWMRCLSDLALEPRWTDQHERQYEAVQAQAALLSGRNGLQAQCKLEAGEFDQLLQQMLPLQAHAGPASHLVQALQARLSAAGTVEWRQYQMLAQLDADLALLLEHIGGYRQATLLNRLKRAVKALLQPRETGRNWQALRAEMLACGLPVPDTSLPDYVAWEQAVIARRMALHAELEAAAGTVLIAHVRGMVVLDAEPAAQGGDWRQLLAVCIAHVQSRCAQLDGEAAKLHERHERCHSELQRLGARRAHYAARLASAQAARDALMDTLGAPGGQVAGDHPLRLMLDAALADPASLSEVLLRQHRRNLILQVQDWLDTRTRPALFHLCARYWEGRYVQSRLDTLVQLAADAAYLQPSAARLRELAMLAPVFVVTAYSAPKLMRRDLAGPEENLPPYLFGEADLLIVDEAGQGTPEVGASAFMFAKRAIVVGDVEQLEPVWAVGEAGDRLLAQRFGIADAAGQHGGGSGAYAALRPAGVSMAHGSVMSMAQRASWRSDPAGQSPGLTLTNHYRCLAPIIEICNRMVYRGALSVATRPPKRLWRPELARLGYLEIDTVADTKNPGGSRRNLAEAACIARWIKENETSLLRHFDPFGKKDLADLVAIVTPFKGQKAILKEALAKEYGVVRMDSADRDALYNRMVIDTVHSLQGAEKPVVIFSMVETNNPAEKQFYDKGSNLINVAVSRAKEMFIVAMTRKAVAYARELPEKPLRKPSDHLWRAVVQQGSRLNARHVVVVESPNKCQAIHEALGGSLEWKVIDTAGHISSLAPPDQWDAGKAFEPVWSAPSPKGEKALADLQHWWQGLETLYLATDPDPEGEAIAWHILRVLGERSTTDRVPGAREGEPAIRRMRFHRLEPGEILRARREAAYGLDAGLVKSALARNLLDHLIAVRYPQRLGLPEGQRYTAGIGRVQLGILDLVQRACGRPARYGIEVRIPVAEGGSMTGWLANRGQQGMGAVSSWSSAGEAAPFLRKLQAVLADPEAAVCASWSGRVQQHPPLPAVNTARMLALAYRSLALAPAATMDLLQGLYEGTAQRTATSATALPEVPHD